MEKRNILVVFNPLEYKIAGIMKDLEDEGYRDAFWFTYIASDISIMSDRTMAEIPQYEEIWTFGDCMQSDILGFAKKKGCDIWIMG